LPDSLAASEFPAKIVRVNIGINVRPGTST
jgi:hypothetical protein